MKQFSARFRNQYFNEATEIQYDLIIIGGGITGAGIALDSASRGMKVLLLEKHDFASGTSSKSTKLIHGGLRYLKQLQFGVVYQTGQERAILHRNAPHLVKPEPMVLPVIKHGSLGKFSTSVALLIYETLAGVKKHERYKMLDKEATLKREPLFDSEKILASAVYSEYRTDDSRLTISIVKSAVNLGAKCINYANVSTFIKHNDKVVGVEVQDVISGKNFSIRGRVVVNAAGPWVDDLRIADGHVNNKHLLLSKGVHIVLPFSKLPVKQSSYFDTPDGRMVFAIPRDGITYVGTTDTEYIGHADNPRITMDDQVYLINACNNLFPSISLSVADIISSWTGLRPLIYEKGKSSSELSRKDEVFESPTGLISIAGGKLTGYRIMAKKVVDLVSKRLYSQGLKFEKCSTKNLVISGGNFRIGDDIEKYIEKQAGEAKQIGTHIKQIRDWVNRYGSQTERIVEKGYELWPLVKDKSLVPYLAELHYCIDEEMTFHPCDFWIRRTGTLYYDFPNLKDKFEALYPSMVELLGYSEAQSKDFEYQFLREMDSVQP
jgi:glycerol-3-phosphate dehydrogenase